MGLLSRFKQKQETSEDRDSGEFRSRSEEETSSARGDKKNTARQSKTARKEKPEDPALPEKKRARRRLIGALALVLAAIIGLPMLLDSEPKPLADDIHIQIPSKDKSLPLAAPVERAKQSGRSGDDLSRRSVNALDTTDGGEEIIAAPSSNTNKNKQTGADLSASMAAKNKDTLAAAAVAKKEQSASTSSEVKIASARPEPKPDGQAAKLSAMPTAAAQPKTPAKPAHTEGKSESATNISATGNRTDSKSDSKGDNKLEGKADNVDEAARALAILEAKPASKPAVKTEATEKTATHYVVQVAALATQEKVAELQAKLNAGGVKSYTQKVATTSGDKIRVRVGPFSSKEEAEKARLKLSKLGLGGTLIPN